MRRSARASDVQRVRGRAVESREPSSRTRRRRILDFRFTPQMNLGLNKSLKFLPLHHECRKLVSVFERGQAVNPPSFDTRGQRAPGAAGKKLNFCRAWIGGRIQSLKIPLFSEIKNFSIFCPDGQLRSTFCLKSDSEIFVVELLCFSQQSSIALYLVMIYRNYSKLPYSPRV
jgi:hypothetical protein